METGNSREGDKGVAQVRRGGRGAALRRALSKSGVFRWFGYGVAIGIVSGIVAGVIFYLMQWTSFFSLTYLAGYSPGQPAGEHIVPATVGTPFRPWLLVLLPAIGGLLSGLIVYGWAPEAEGNGMEAFIDAFHNKQGYIRTRVPYIKGIASVLTIGMGGCAGREGPIAQISAGISSWLARVLGLSPRERRLMLMAGCGAGLSAIFRAPLGGALTALEILYREDLETEGIGLCFFSSAVSYLVFITFVDKKAIFAIPPIQVFRPLQLPFYAVLGLACVPCGFIYVKVFYGLRDQFFRKLPIRPRALVPALGGLLVGLMALWRPEVLGPAYGTVQEALMGQLPLTVLVSLVFLKMLANSFSMSSGGSGGIFAPALFIGAMLGGTVGQLAHLWFPGIVSSPGAFTLVGMAAFFAGVAKAPIGAAVMISEITGGYGLLARIMFTSVLSIWLSKGWGIYERQVLNKMDSPAHQTDRLVHMMKGLMVKDVYNPGAPVVFVSEGMTYDRLKGLITDTSESIFAAVDDNSRLTGILSLPEIRAALSKKSVQGMIGPLDLLLPPVSVAPDESISEALVKFFETGLTRIPVTDEDNVVIGMLSLEELLSRQREELDDCLQKE